MTLLSKTTNVRILRETDAATDILPFSGEQRETAGGPLDGEIVTLAQVDYMDALGGAIGPGSSIVRDAITGRPTALCNAFRCDLCGKFHALCYMARQSENITNPQVMPPGNAAPTIRTGICETCWNKGRFKRLLMAIGHGIAAFVRFMIAPFLPEQPDVTPTVAPSAPQQNYEARNNNRDAHLTPPSN